MMQNYIVSKYIFLLLNKNIIDRALFKQKEKIHLELENTEKLLVNRHFLRREYKSCNSFALTFQLLSNFI